MQSIVGVVAVLRNADYKQFTIATLQIIQVIQFIYYLYQVYSFKFISSFIMNQYTGRGRTQINK